MKDEQFTRQVRSDGRVSYKGILWGSDALTEMAGSKATVDVVWKPTHCNLYHEGQPLTAFLTAKQEDAALEGLNAYVEALDGEAFEAAQDLVEDAGGTLIDMVGRGYDPGSAIRLVLAEQGRAAKGLFDSPVPAGWDPESDMTSAQRLRVLDQVEGLLRAAGRSEEEVSTFSLGSHRREVMYRAHVMGETLIAVLAELGILTEEDAAEGAEPEEAEALEEDAEVWVDLRGERVKVEPAQQIAEDLSKEDARALVERLLPDRYAHERIDHLIDVVAGHHSLDADAIGAELAAAGKAEAPQEAMLEKEHGAEEEAEETILAPRDRVGMEFRHREDRTMACEMTDEELAEASQQLADLTHELIELEDEKGTVVSAFNARIKALKARQREVSEERERGTVDRRIFVEMWADYRAGELLTIRDDTGEVIGRRPLTDSERQGSLFRQPAKGSGTFFEGEPEGADAPPAPVDATPRRVIDGDSVGDRLAQARELAGLTQDAAARAMVPKGVPKERRAAEEDELVRFIIAVEEGDEEVTDATLILFAELYGVSRDALLAKEPYDLDAEAAKPKAWAREEEGPDDDIDALFDADPEDVGDPFSDDDAESFADEILADFEADDDGIPF